MARVNVEQKALTDPRFHRLGVLLGAKPKYAQAVGLHAMMMVWNYCIEQCQHTLDGWVLDSILNEKDVGPHICFAHLAEQDSEGKFRIKGTDGRIEYLQEKRSKGRLNGYLGGEHGKKGGRPPKPPDGVFENPLVGSGGNPPPAPAPDTAPKDKESKDTHSSGATEVEAEIIKAWNELGTPFPRVIGVTNSRRKAIRARMKDSWWLEHWWLAMHKVPDCPFLSGSGNRGWVANLDWFLRPDSVQAIIEGKYESVPKNGMNGTLMETMKANTEQFLASQGHDTN